MIEQLCLDYNLNSNPKTETINPYPFIKWVGGKQKLVSKLVDYMPEEYTSYREPFLGGGSLLFKLNPNAASISDINFKLINTYIVIRDNIDELIELLRIHEKYNSKEYYLKCRDSFNSNMYSNVYMASLFIYLNKTCFNGLYRVNKQNKFNVSYGYYKNPKILDEDNLRNVSKSLFSVEIQCKQYSEVNVKSNEFVYLDPPYHKTFDKYSNELFDDIEHIKLYEYCKHIDKLGAKFMLSNSNTEFINELYNDFNIKIINSRTSVSAVSKGRKNVTEVLITNY